MTNLKMFSVRIEEKDKHALKVIAAQKDMKVQDIISRLVSDYVRDNRVQDWEAGK